MSIEPQRPLEMTQFGQMVVTIPKRHREDLDDESKMTGKATKMLHILNVIIRWAHCVHCILKTVL